MRLYNFLSISSGDNEESVFRSLNLDLVESDTGNSDLVRRITEKYMLDDTAMMLLEKANKELKEMYRGKLRFDFCLEEQGKSLQDTKMGRKKIGQLKEKWFKFNDELSNIQISFEKCMRKGLQK